jgi:hypothetical protein
MDAEGTEYISDVVVAASFSDPHSIGAWIRIHKEQKRSKTEERKNEVKRQIIRHKKYLKLPVPILLK